MCRIDAKMHFAGLKQPMPELIVHMDSLDIFPVSWCETNGYPLIYPIKPSGTQPTVVPVKADPQSTAGFR